jgi:thioesterase domain-containing protein
MARQLLASGQQIRFLGLMETVAMPPSLTNYRYYLRRLRCFLGMRPRGWKPYLAEKLRYYREAERANRMRFRGVGDSTEADPSARDPRLIQLEKVYDANLRALKKYRSTPYPGRVTLFNASEADPALLPDPQYGWSGLAGEIEIHLVPGNHDTMLAEPHAAVLAGKLLDCLWRAQGR